MLSQENIKARSIVIRHLVLGAVAILILTSIYLYTQNPSSVALSAIVLVLAHVAAVAGIYYVGRGLLRRLFRKMHGMPAEDTHTHAHLETEGAIIDWPILYNLLVKALFMGKEQQFREGVVDLAQIQAGQKVLEVGCGTGTLAIIAKQKSGADVSITATDAAPEMIQQARESAKKAGVDVDFQIGLAESTQFPDDSFDVVMNSLMVHHLPGDLKSTAFAEMYRVLKPGGRLLIVDFEPPKRGITHGLLRVVLGNGMMQIVNSKNIPLLEDAGFTAIEIGNTGHSLATFIRGQKPSD